MHHTLGVSCNMRKYFFLLMIISIICMESIYNDKFIPSKSFGIVNTFQWSEIWKYIIGIPIMVSCIFLTFFPIITIFYIKYCLYRPINMKKFARSDLPGVSIIKPLTGVDSCLKANLISFFELDYPLFELLFCLETDSDPAYHLVQELMLQYPDVNARVFVTTKILGVNPKLNNTHEGYAAAQFDRVLVSDCRMAMRSDTLLDMVIRMESENHVGLVHQVPYILPKPGPYSFTRSLELVFFGTWYAKFYMTSAVLGINCTVGMSCLFRKHVLDGAGGLARYANYLADDLLIAQLFYDLGWRVRVCAQPAWQNYDEPSMENFFDRLIRWFNMRLATTPVTTIIEPMSESFSSSAMAAYFAALFFPEHVNGLYVFLFLMAVWFTTDYIIFRLMVPPNSPDCIKFGQFSYLWLFREISNHYVRVGAFLNPHVSWRNRVFKMRWGGYTEEIIPTSSSF